jgi:hypothetical protein
MLTSGRIRRHFEMDTLLTLVIALGGIATGIGAIWTAMVTRHLARATERSIAEQSESFREQNERAREQIERARINLEVDLMQRLGERWDTPRFLNYRRRSLTYVKETYFVDDDILEVQHLDVATEMIFSFFEDIGYLTRTGVLRIERVWLQFAGIKYAWALWEPAVKKQREEQEDPLLFEELEYLYRQIVDFDQQRGSTGAPPTKVELRRFVELELRSATVDDEDTTNE